MIAHPDRNDSPNAHEEFVQLNEAYELLMDYKSGKIKIATARPKQQRRTTRQKGFTAYEQEQRRRAEARRRAQEHARMQYEEFKKTDFYKKSKATVTVLKHLYFGFSILILSIPVFGVIKGGVQGLLLGLFLVFLFTPIWYDALRNYSQINGNEFFESFGVLIKTKVFWYISFSVFNAVSFFYAIINTELTTVSIVSGVSLIAGLGIVSSFVKFRLIKSLPNPAIIVCLVPALINLFFLVNYVFSSNPVVENYTFELEQSSTLITLEDDAYEDYMFIRLFFDIEQMTYKKEVQFTFEEGLFGFRVLKAFEFHEDY